MGLDREVPNPQTGVMANTDVPQALTPEAEALLLHFSIQAVAAQCDGAISDDGVGFDGGDTAYGRRIASVPFAKLTVDDNYEIARICNKYQKQILARTGVDVTTLATVVAAKGGATNHQSRQNARKFEKLSATRAARRVTLLDNGKVGVAWGRDPEFNELLAGVRALPGRQYNGATKTNEVDATEALLAFANDFDMEVPGEVLAAVEARTVSVATAAQVEAQRPQVALDRDGKLVIAQAVTNDAEIRALVFRLPGRRWNGQNNVVDASPEARDLFARHGLRLSENATNALAAAGEAVEAPTQTEALSRSAMLAQASRAGSINDLPESFLALVRQATGA